MGQQGDVLLFQTVDDGDINVSDGIVEMSGGLETTAYLSLFGGNEDDDGRDGNSATWWANLNETGDSRKYRSETQNLLQAITAVPANLRRIEDAARRDLSWLLSDNVASKITIAASMPGLNKVRLIIDIEALGEESQFEFVENWKAEG